MLMSNINLNSNFHVKMILGHHKRNVTITAVYAIVTFNNGSVFLLFLL